MVGPLSTPLTALLGIQHPVVLAGMARVSGGALAAAVSNAGGLGVVGGFRLTPDQLRETVADLKANLRDKSLPFGIDLALPQVGGGARPTNYDYTAGKLDELIDIVIAEKAALFVSAVGVPPPHVIRRLHEAGILVMNMVGHPKHAAKALAAGVDLVCAQGTEGGGHTGPVAGTVLVPAVVDVAEKVAAERKRRGGGANASRFPLQTPLVLAAGGIADGRGLAAALMQGAAGVWVGTRFVASVEADCSEQHKQAVVTCGPDDTDITLVLTGRPLRTRLNAYLRRWHEHPEKIQELCRRGIIPFEHDLESQGRPGHAGDGETPEGDSSGEEDDEVEMPYLMGQVAGNITKVQPAKEIVDEMVAGAVAALRRGQGYLGERSRL